MAALKTQVTVLANGLASAGHVVSVLVFYPDGPLINRLSPDVTVRCLKKRGRWDLIVFLRSLFRVLEEERPDVLYAFLPWLTCWPASPDYPRVS